MSFRNFLRPLVLEMLEDGRAVIAADVVKEAQVRYPDEYADEVGRLAFNAANREVKDFLKSLSEDDDSPQLALPGLDLPSVIAIPTEGGFVYKATASCDWGELRAGLSTREQNVAAAQRKLDAYLEQLDLLRPVMEGTSLTTQEAARILAEGSS
jgi:hypothetical protein